ncbi:MAG: PAS domain S-box protein [Chloroflexi bacterium]|nr:PAS domain S-box protein [Chloroflexota bacterium]MDA1240948.1 PAS domain S-box protein [Chloroflexota bacterium]
MADDTIFRTITDTSPEATVWAGKDGLIKYWNQGAEEMFGHTAAEAVGQSLDLIIPENLRARHWEGYDRVMVDGQPSKYGRREMLKVPALHQAGHRMSVEFTLQTAEHPEHGTIAVAVIRDATETFNELRELRKQLAAAQAASGGRPA